MKIHEYQAKAILKKYGVAVPRGEMAETREIEVGDWRFTTDLAGSLEAAPRAISMTSQERL